MIDPNENLEQMMPAPTPGEEAQPFHCGGVASEVNYLMGETPNEEILYPENSDRRFMVIEDGKPVKRLNPGTIAHRHIPSAAAFATITSVRVAIDESAKLLEFTDVPPGTPLIAEREFDVEAAEQALSDLFTQASTEIGVVLRQLGRQAAEIKPTEIARFKRDFDVHVTKNAAGIMRFEVTKKGKKPSWKKDGAK